MIRRDAVRRLYAQLDAPSWAAPNLDGLADVLRDLSWLPDGPVALDLSALDELSEADRTAVLAVLDRALRHGAGRPLRLGRTGA